MIVRLAILVAHICILPIFCSPPANLELIPDFTIMIPMQDGTELPTDLYFPDSNTEPLPCILLRSPAGRKAFPWRNYARLAQEGFLVAIQDTRSALDEEGKSIPYIADGWGQKKDGFDAVEWLAASGFTNGNIGTIGFSASGIVQQMMAPTAPPSLKCQYIGVAAGSLYHHAVYPGERLLKNQVEGWLGIYARHPSIYNLLCSQPTYNDFWKNFDSLSMAHEVDVPAIHYGGWFDTFIQGTLDSFVTRQNSGKEKARGKQKIVIGPWIHFWPETMTLGDFTVPKIAREMPQQFHPKRWFDHYLKNIDNQVQELPPVTYFVMGPFDGSPSIGNKWKTASKWPVDSQKTLFYLDRNYKLSKDLKFEKHFYQYNYDSNNPVPTIGGRNLFLESGPKDQRPIESREDVIVFTSEPFNEDVEITGQIFATLFCSSNFKNTDVVIRFCDCYPDGKSILIADGIGRINPNNTDISEEFLDKPFEILFDLWSTSFVVAKGHSLRVSVSNSNYPKYEKNEHIEGSQKNRIYIGTKFPSHISLPIVKHFREALEPPSDKPQI